MVILFNLGGSKMWLNDQSIDVVSNSLFMDVVRMRRFGVRSKKGEKGVGGRLGWGEWERVGRGCLNGVFHEGQVSNATPKAMIYVHIPSWGVVRASNSKPFHCFSRMWPFEGVWPEGTDRIDILFLPNVMDRIFPFKGVLAPEMLLEC